MNQNSKTSPYPPTDGSSPTDAKREWESGRVGERVSGGLRPLLLSPALPLVLFCLAGHLWSQPLVSHITGRTLDHERVPIANVMLLVVETREFTQSDKDGNFLLQVPPDRLLTLQARRSGYHSLRLELKPIAAGDSLSLTLTLRENPIALPEVIVEDENFHLREHLQLSRTPEITLRQPGAFEDPLRNLQQLPGVTLRSDWDSQISLRGATPDQNLVVIDGFTLPNPYRMQFAFGGGMAVINAGILQQASIWKSGFSSRYGDRVAGLLMLETKPAHDEASKELRLNVLDASMSAAIPFRERGGLLTSLRRSYHDAFKSLAALKNVAIPRWSDMQLKAVYHVSPKQQLEVLAIGGKESLNLEFGDLYEGRILENAKTLFVGALHRWTVGEQVVYESHFSHFQGPSRLAYFEDDEILLADYRFDDRTWHWRNEVSWKSSERAQWLLGIELMWQRQWADMKFSSFSMESPLVLPEDFHGQRWRRLAALYAEHRLRLSEAFAIRPGLRLAGQDLQENLNAEPRLTIYGSAGRRHYRLHWGVYYQTADWQSLFRREIPLDVRDWRNLPRERAILWSADFNIGLIASLQLAAGVYTRNMDPLIVPIDEAEGQILEFRNSTSGATSVNQLQANRPRITRGRQSGVELALSQAIAAWRWELRYSYSRSRMRDLDDLKWIPMATDRPHDAALDLSWRILNALQLGSLLRYASGNPYTPIVAISRDLNHSGWPEDLRLHYGARNSVRVKDYVRIDVRATFRAGLFGGDAELYVEWLNAGNHKNVYQYLWGTKALKDNEGEIIGPPVELQKHTIIMMPRLVVGGLSIRW